MDLKELQVVTLFIPVEGQVRLLLRQPDLAELFGETKRLAILNLEKDGRMLGSAVALRLTRDEAPENTRARLAIAHLTGAHFSLFGPVTIKTSGAHAEALIEVMR